MASEDGVFILFYLILFFIYLFLEGRVKNVLFCAWSFPAFGTRGNQKKAINNVGVVYQSISRILMKSIFFPNDQTESYTLFNLKIAVISSEISKKTQVHLAFMVKTQINNSSFFNIEISCLNATFLI